MLGANCNKREAHSPLSGDDEDLKRRIVGDEATVLVALDGISEEDEPTEKETELGSLLSKEGENEPGQDIPMGKKVDLLIGRMDRFMSCFATLHTTVTKNQRINDKKFKSLETAHNDFAVKVASSTASNRSRIESLESQLKESLTKNAAMADRITQLEESYTRNSSIQNRVNDQHSKQIKNLKIEQSFTNRNVHDCYAEVKERKLIISGVAKFPGENTTVIALGCINKIIGAAINAKHPDANLEGLKKLQYNSIDKAFRLGRRGKYNKRNIVVTLARSSDKEMIYLAKSELIRKRA